ncbi:OPT oligopeptide transporter [Abortiporus biennis]|nr:OPT oligopeptide transporter [Abortiporus biennis]
MEFDFDAVDEEDSPYPEVRAAVSNVDDPEMPAMTLRMWVIGLFLSLTVSAANVFFTFRQPAPSIVSAILLLVAHPVGKIMALTLPITPYRIPKFLGLGPYEINLNPGPWNIKEHALVYMMTNVSVQFPYAIFAIVVAEFNYGARLGYGFSTTLVLATQLTGFGLAGMSRRFLVWPASMIWPQNLMICTLLNTFHAEEDKDRGGLSRYRWFLYVFLGAFFWFFIPGYLFTALSIFSWICWIAPNNIPINQVFGVYSGLGLSTITFDWTQITWTTSPLITPWWAQVHTFFGFVCFYWILAPALYYTNVWNLAHFPILANAPYDRFGKPYNISAVLRPDDTFDLEAFEAYSPLYLPASYAITYLIAFALSSCIIVHTILYYGPAVLLGLKRQPIEQDDIHAKLMRAYPEVPDWWYLLVFSIFFSLAIVANEVWHTGLPVWGLLLAIVIVVVFVIPSGYIFAMTNLTLSTNILAQIIPGVLLPGKPIANMFFKAYVIQSLTEATNFVQDLKLGHYIKVPPRATFIVQITATTLAALVQVAVKELMFDNIPDICQPNQESALTCPHNQVYYTASAVWGLIGPSRQFGSGSIYHPQLYALIIGAILPIPFWWWQKKYPNNWNRWISTPVALNAVTYIPPATGINYSSWFLTGFIFQYWIRSRHFAWWSKFNYVTSAAMDSGTLVSILFIFFVLEIPKGGFQVNWWGNTVWQNTADFNHLPLLSTPPEGL